MFLGERLLTPWSNLSGRVSMCPVRNLGKNIGGLSFLGVKVSGCPGRILGSNLAMGFFVPW